MSSRGVSTLKFVGTVSLGLLTGLSYTLSTLTVPTLLTLPSASTASRAFNNLTTNAQTHLRSLAGVSGTAFAFAFFLSPRAFRHPYLLYTSILVLSSRLVVSDAIAPYLMALPQHKQATSSSSHSQTQSRTTTTSRTWTSSTRRMEMSYDMIGSEVHSDATLDSASDRSAEDDSSNNNGSTTAAEVNGEEVRGEVEAFLKKQTVSTVLAGLGFAMAVVGIWGDGAAAYVSETFVNVIEI